MLWLGVLLGYPLTRKQCPSASPSVQHERSAQKIPPPEAATFSPVFRTSSGRGYPAMVRFRWLRCKLQHGWMIWATASPESDRKRPIHSSNESIKGSYSGDRRSSFRWRPASTLTIGKEPSCRNFESLAKRTQRRRLDHQTKDHSRPCSANRDSANESRSCPSSADRH